MADCSDNDSCSSNECLWALNGEPHSDSSFDQGVSEDVESDSSDDGGPRKWKTRVALPTVQDDSDDGGPRKWKTPVKIPTLQDEGLRGGGCSTSSVGCDEAFDMGVAKNLQTSTCTHMGDEEEQEALTGGSYGNGHKAILKKVAEFEAAGLSAAVWALESRSHISREAALLSLRKLAPNGDAASLAFVIERCKDPGQDHILLEGLLQGVPLLAQNGDEDAISMLATMPEYSCWVTKYCAEGLGKLGVKNNVSVVCEKTNTTVVARLLAMSAHKSWQVMEAALVALAQLVGEKDSTAAFLVANELQYHNLTQVRAAATSLREKLVDDGFPEPDYPVVKGRAIQGKKHGYGGGNGAIVDAILAAQTRH